MRRRLKAKNSILLLGFVFCMMLSVQTSKVEANSEEAGRAIGAFAQVCLSPEQSQAEAKEAFNRLGIPTYAILTVDEPMPKASVFDAGGSIGALTNRGGETCVVIMRGRYAQPAEAYLRPYLNSKKFDGKVVEEQRLRRGEAMSASVRMSGGRTFLLKAKEAFASGYGRYTALEFTQEK